MQISVGSRVKHAWNAFLNRDPTIGSFGSSMGYIGGHRPDRFRFGIGNERSIVASIYNQIAIDISSISFRHAQLDENERYTATIYSDLNECLTLSTNVDQTARAFIQDLVMSMFDEGCVAIVPVDTTSKRTISEVFDVQSMRVGKVTSWFPQHVRVELYNEQTGRREEITLPKETVCIIENPLYAVMNEPNSTLKRLIRKLNLLDAVDEQSGSGKLDMIIQFPFVIKTEAMRLKAEERRANMENQLKDSKYGIAYTDGTEKVTQLNRPAENNLMGQITYLTSMLYSQLGMTESIFNGTADEGTMLNYFNRTIEPICSAICGAMKWKFLTKTARSQRQSIVFFRDPFKLVPAKDLAEIADKFTRNEILSSNDVRGIIGYKPSNDPKADELRNKNLNQAENPPTKNEPDDDHMPA